MEFAIGAAAAVAAVMFTNPLEVVKTRFQLQGELSKKGTYTVHYKNIFHAFYIIARKEGIFALQKGFGSAATHQVLLNGVRLGGYQMAEEGMLTVTAAGGVAVMETLMVGGAMGVVGAYTGSPFYLVKTRLQAQANQNIAVGHQYKYRGTLNALAQIYKTGGIRGLWRGVGGSIPRLAVGSATQLTTFKVSKQYLANNPYCKIEEGIWNTLSASMLGGVAVAITMGPLDVISTRLYNQVKGGKNKKRALVNKKKSAANVLKGGKNKKRALLNKKKSAANVRVDKSGNGLLYKNFMDCMKKIYKTEGFAGFYKGIVPCYIRIGPHTVLCFTFWDLFRDMHQSLKANLGKSVIPSKIENVEPSNEKLLAEKLMSNNQQISLNVEPKKR